MNRQETNEYLAIKYTRSQEHPKSAKAKWAAGISAKWAAELDTLIDRFYSVGLSHENFIRMGTLCHRLDIEFSDKGLKKFQEMMG